MFWHDLAALLGGMTVGELQTRMDSQEFTNWNIWARLRGGFGETRADLRNGVLCAMIANIANAMHGVDGNAKPSDFVLYDDQPKATEAEAKRAASVSEQVELLGAVLGQLKQVR